MVAGSAAASDRPQSAVHHLPATASLRAALGLLVETAGAADALSVPGKAEYTIEDFKASMDAPPSLSDFGQVKRRIIDPAVKELTEKDGWLIQWVPVKAGRKVKALRFTFMRDPQGRLEL